MQSQSNTADTLMKAIKKSSVIDDNVIDNQFKQVEEGLMNLSRVLSSLYLTSLTNNSLSSNSTIAPPQQAPSQPQPQQPQSSSSVKSEFLKWNYNNSCNDNSFVTKTKERNTVNPWWIHSNTILDLSIKYFKGYNVVYEIKCVNLYNSVVSS